MKAQEERDIPIPVALAAAVIVFTWDVIRDWRIKHSRDPLVRQRLVAERQQDEDRETDWRLNYPLGEHKPV